MKCVTLRNPPADGDLGDGEVVEPVVFDAVSRAGGRTLQLRVCPCGHSPGKGLLSRSRATMIPRPYRDRRPLLFPSPQLGSSSIGTARARLSSPPNRLNVTWPTSYSAQAL